MSSIARPPCDEAAMLAGSCRQPATTNGGWILAATILGSSMAFIDGTVQVDQPELLLYEPQADGSKQLVAVEYIIPYTAHARSDTPPVLFGQQFKQNDTFQLWGLHVWAWKTNPSGLYADWNPQVNCNNTTDIQPMETH